MVGNQFISGPACNIRVDNKLQRQVPLRELGVDGSGTRPARQSGWAEVSLLRRYDMLSQNEPDA